MRELPSGTVTFLFTDVEGSTRLLQALGERYGDALESHRRLLRQAFAEHEGVEVDAQGDSFFVSFRSARDAVGAATQAQRSLASQPWPEGLPLRVRMGLHTGEPTVHAGGYIGVDVHRAARICAAGHGGQVLLSQATRELLPDELGDGLDLRDLGNHRLKDLTHPQRLYQLVIPLLESDFPALKTLENRSTNLPTQPTPLIGRRRELEEATVLLRREEVRLLTLTGPGGTGKTRLALQLAAELLDEFPHGAFLVNLSTVADPALVVATISQTLGVRELQGRTLEQTLAEHLRERRLLLLLDNLEQLLASAPSVASLLAGAPALKLLVTSRAPLRVAGEHELAVPPLELPDVRELPGPAALSQFESVALFVERARAVKSGFEVTNENARAVAEICIRLDGLPLAIELAAARIRALPPSALLERLKQRLSLLVSGPLDAPTRQQTLRATIDWSYALLTEAEQRLFARLSVFVGGWDLEAAEAVYRDDGLLDILSSLIENSLVLERDDPQGAPRYSMLETIREYGLERLDASAETEVVRLRHAEHVLMLAEQADRVVTGDDFSLPGAPEERMEGELPNLRAALGWLLEQGRSELALRLASASGWTWALIGANTEGRRWVTRALEAAEHLENVDRAKAIFALGEFAQQQGDFRDADELLEHAGKLFQAGGDGRGVVLSLLELSIAAASTGDLAQARVRLNAGRELAHAIASDYLVARSVFDEALVEDLAGNFDRAQELTEEGLERFRELGVPERRWVHLLVNVGWFALQRHDFPRARMALEEYLAAGSSKSPIGVAIANSNLGLVALYEGDHDAAASRFRRALALARDPGAKPTLAEALFGLASVAAIDGDARRSVSLRCAAEKLKQEMATQLTAPEKFVVDRYLDPAQSDLSQEAMLNARAQGSSMTLDQALAYAIEGEV